MRRGFFVNSQVSLWPRLWRLFVRICRTVFNASPPPIGRAVMGFIEQRRSGARKADPERRDFLTRLLEEEAAGKPTDVFAPLSINVAAGSDTTGVSLSGAVYYLMRNPEKLQKLRREVDEAFAQGAGGDSLGFTQAQRMPYLQATVKEALRIHSAVGTTLPRVVPAGGAHLAGEWFPGGVSIPRVDVVEWVC